MRIKAIDEDILLRNPVPFFNVLEACEVLRDESSVMDSIAPTMSAGLHRFNETKSEDMLFDGVRKLVALKDAAVSEHFLIAVLGGASARQTRCTEFAATHIARQDR